jgi:hypothetical protein
MATQLPVAPQEYDRTNEQTTRRTVEQNAQDIEARLDRSIRKIDKLSSLSIRRFQFLLMGAGNG